MKQVAIIVMAKAPQAGKVKTRLCPPLSLRQAAELYQCFLLDAIARVKRLRRSYPVVAYTPASSRKFFERLAPGCALIPQEDGDLGERMAFCFARLFDQGFTEILLTGSDLPTLPISHLEQAIQLITLPSVDVVLGPSDDGGYYLIGLRRLQKRLFGGMTWSTAAVFAETVRRATAAGLTMACVPSWYDIDTPADLDHLRSTLMQNRNGVAWHTRRFLKLSAVAGELARP